MLTCITVVLYKKLYIFFSDLVIEFSQASITVCEGENVTIELTLNTLGNLVQPCLTHCLVWWVNVTRLP